MMDAMMTGINWVGTTKPAYPISGDAYLDSTGAGFVWTGVVWTQISTNTSMDPPKKRLEPTLEELEKHPSLKAAWDEYMVLRKLIGI
jgi:hypothetical protein